MNNLQKWLTFRPWQRHGLVQMVGGLAYLFLGVGFLTLGELSVRRSDSISVALSVAPVEFWAFVFIGAGALAVLSSRWPAFHDTWGYMVLVGLSAGWSGVYFTSYFLGPANINNIPYGVIWALLAFMWWAISGLVNPEKILVVEVPDGSN